MPVQRAARTEGDEPRGGSELLGALRNQNRELQVGSFVEQCMLQRLVRENHAAGLLGKQLPQASRSYTRVHLSVLPLAAKQSLCK